MESLIERRNTNNNTDILRVKLTPPPCYMSSILTCDEEQIITPNQKKILWHDVWYILGVTFLFHSNSPCKRFNQEKKKLHAMIYSVEWLGELEFTLLFLLLLFLLNHMGRFLFGVRPFLIHPNDLWIKKKYVSLLSSLRVRLKLYIVLNVTPRI